MGFGFGVWGLGFGVWGLGFGVWGLGFGVWGLGFGVWGLGLLYRVQVRSFERKCWAGFERKFFVLLALEAVVKLKLWAS